MIQIITQRIRKDRFFYKKLAKKLTIVALICSLATTQTSHAIFGFAYDLFKSTKEKIEAVKKKAKTTAKAVGYSVAGYLGYKKFIKPLSKIILGDKIRPVLRKIDRVINIILLAGGIAGVLYLYRKFSSDKKVIKKITEAKDKIIGHVTQKVKALKKYVSHRADKTDAKLDNIDKEVTDGFGETKEKLNKIDGSVETGFDETGNKLNKIDKTLEKRFNHTDNKLSEIKAGISIFGKKETQNSVACNLDIEKADISFAKNFAPNSINPQVSKLQKKIRIKRMSDEPYVKNKIKIPRFILLHGKTQVGKSLSARALARELGAKKYISCTGAQMQSKYIGESSNILINAFRKAENFISKNTPGVLIIEEIDGAMNMLSNGATREIAETLQYLRDNIITNNKNIYVIATTNYVDDLPMAIRSRFETNGGTIEVKSPSKEARKQILKSKAEKEDIKVSEKWLEETADKTTGYNIVQLQNIITAIHDQVIQEQYENKNLQLDKDIHEVTPSNNPNNHKINKEKKLPKGIVSNIKNRVKKVWATVSAWFKNWANFESKAAQKIKKKPGQINKKSTKINTNINMLDTTPSAPPLESKTLPNKKQESDFITNIDDYNKAIAGQEKAPFDTSLDLSHGSRTQDYSG